MSFIFKYGINGVNRSELEPFWEKLKALDPDKAYNLYVFNDKPNRTTAQNKYYWGVVLETIYNEIDGSYTKEQLHETFKKELNPKLTEIGGKMIEHGGSTKEMTKEEFITFVEKVKAWALEVLEVRVLGPEDLSDEALIDFMENY